MFQQLDCRFTARLFISQHKLERFTLKLRRHESQTLRPNRTSAVYASRQKHFILRNGLSSSGIPDELILALHSRCVNFSNINTKYVRRFSRDIGGTCVNNTFRSENRIPRRFLVCLISRYRDLRGLLNGILQMLFNNLSIFTLCNRIYLYL
jgi:hypothetical protein